MTGRRAILSLAVVAALTSGCQRQQTRSPEALRDAYAKALRDNDPEAAYALLSPQAQSEVDLATFKARWKTQKAEHAAQAKAIDDLDGAERDAVLEGRTTHPGGRTVQWARVDDRWVVVNGVPGLPNTVTAEGAVRALIAALRSLDTAGLERIVSPELVEQFGEEWEARADLIEAALEDPGALEYPDEKSLQRAVLDYGPGGQSITLEQTPRGWRIIDLR